MTVSAMPRCDSLCCVCFTAGQLSRSLIMSVCIVYRVLHTIANLYGISRVTATLFHRILRYRSRAVWQFVLAGYL